MSSPPSRPGFFFQHIVPEFRNSCFWSAMSMWWWVFSLTVRGEYLISDWYNHRVQLCDGLTCLTVAGTGVNGSGGTQLDGPSGLAVTAAGEYVVADHFNHRVRLCAADTVRSSCTTIAGTGSSGQGSTELYLRRGLAFDGSGDLLIADYGNHRVQLCPFDSPRTGCATVVGTGTSGSGAAELSSPLSVVLDGAGDYVVADRHNHRIQLCPASLRAVRLQALALRVPTPRSSIDPAAWLWTPMRTTPLRTSRITGCNCVLRPTLVQIAALWLVRAWPAPAQHS